jgi:5'-nucleotidase/UDP-sugar diphosphatase
MRPVLLRAWLLAGLLAAVLAGQTVPFVILHTNDLHGQIRPLPDPRVRGDEAPLVGGYQELVAAIDELRAETPHTVLVDAGDWFQGTPEGTLSRGRAMVELMNAAGYDLAVLGNHEFDCGPSALVDLLRLARFPVLGRNLRGAGDGAHADLASEILARLRPGLTLEVEGVRVRFDGLLTEESMAIVPQALLSGLVIEPEVEAARRLRAEEPPGGADVWILVNHVGRDRNAILAREVPGFDVIIGGHDHRSSLEDGTLVPSTGTLIAQAASHGRALGIVRLELDTRARKVVSKRAFLRWIHPDPGLRVPRILPIIERHERAVAAEMDRPVAEVAARLARGGTPEEPSPLGAWICAALIAETGADVAIHNLGGIRAELPAGPATVREFFQVSPFGNRVSLVTLEAKAVAEIAAHSLAQWSRGAVFGGLELVWTREEGQRPRLLRLERNGRALAPGDRLRIATTDYLAAGNDHLSAFRTGTDRVDLDVTLLDLTIAAARKAGTVRPVTVPSWRRE